MMLKLVMDMVMVFRVAECWLQLESLGFNAGDLELEITDER